MTRPKLTFPQHEGVYGPGSAWALAPQLACVMDAVGAEVSFALTALPLLEGEGFSTQYAWAPTTTGRVDVLDLPDGTYYFRARARVDGRFGEWSEIRRFSVALHGPVPARCPGLTPGLDLPYAITHESGSRTAGRFVIEGADGAGLALDYSVFDEVGSVVWAVRMRALARRHVHGLVRACAEAARAAGARLAARGRTRFEVSVRAGDLLVELDGPLLDPVDPTDGATRDVETVAGRLVLFEHVVRDDGCGGALYVTEAPDPDAVGRETYAAMYECTPGGHEWRVSLSRFGLGPLDEGAIRRLGELAAARGAKLTAADVSALHWQDHGPTARYFTGRTRRAVVNAPPQLVRYCRIFYERFPPRPMTLGSVTITPEGGALRCDWTVEDGPARRVREGHVGPEDVERLRVGRGGAIEVFETTDVAPSVGT